VTEGASLSAVTKS